jgi:hypothetical protein
MDTIVPDTVRTLSVVQVAEMEGDGQALRLASVQGVGGQHEAWLLTDVPGDDQVIVYLERVDSGSLEGLRRYNQSLQILPAWTLPSPITDAEKYLEIQRAACLYVVEKAHEEVKAEMT